MPTVMQNLTGRDSVAPSTQTSFPLGRAGRRPGFSPRRPNTPSPPLVFRADVKKWTWLAFMYWRAALSSCWWGRNVSGPGWEWRLSRVRLSTYPPSTLCGPRSMFSSVQAFQAGTMAKVGVGEGAVVPGSWSKSPVDPSSSLWLRVMHSLGAVWERCFFPPAQTRWKLVGPVWLGPPVLAPASCFSAWLNKLQRGRKRKRTGLVWVCWTGRLSEAGWVAQTPEVQEGVAFFFFFLFPQNGASCCRLVGGTRGSGLYWTPVTNYINSPKP